MASSASELVAIVLSGIMYKKWGIKLSFFVSYIISVVGGICILIWGAAHPGLMPFFIIFAKFGISAGFVIVYVCTVDIFPTLFCATAIGFCNFFARIATILAPEVAVRSAPLPMLIFTSMTSLGAVLSLFLRPPKTQDA